MNSTTPHHPLHYHTWKDIGGPIGLLLDWAFCCFVVVAALAMIVFAFVVLMLDYVASAAMTLVSKLRLSPPTRSDKVSATWEDAPIKLARHL